MKEINGSINDAKEKGFIVTTIKPGDVLWFAGVLFVSKYYVKTVSYKIGLDGTLAISVQGEIEGENPPTIAGYPLFPSYDVGDRVFLTEEEAIKRNEYLLR